MKNLLIVALAVILTSCGGGGIDASKFLAERDSIINENARQQKELNEINSIMNEVASCLDSIAEKEKFLYVSEEGVKLPNKAVLDNLRAFKDLLNRQRQQIIKLQDSLYHRNDSTSKYYRIINYLNNELAEKDLIIQNLQKEIALHKKSISDLHNHNAELKKNVAELKEKDELQTEALSRQDAILNECFVLVGTKKELQDLGVITGKFLQKKKVNYSNLNNDLFTKVDIRHFTELPIASKRVKILTAMPQQSYRLVNNASGTTLYIDDVTTFWSVTNYLIIQTN